TGSTRCPCSTAAPRGPLERRRGAGHDAAGRGSRVGSPSARFATPARPPQPLPLPAASALQTLSPGAALIPTPRPGPPAFQERPPMRRAFFILGPCSIAPGGSRAGRVRLLLAPRVQGGPDPGADRL